MDTKIEIDTRIEDMKRAYRAVKKIGFDKARKTREVYTPLSKRLDEYEEEATGLGDFDSYIELQSVLAELGEEAKEKDVYDLTSFEEAIERFERTTLREKDFRRAREDLADVDRLVDALDTYEDAREELEGQKGRLENRRKKIVFEKSELESKISSAEKAAEIDNSELVELVESYNSRIEDEFDTFMSKASAVEVLELGRDMDESPLLDNKPVPQESIEVISDTEVSDATPNELLDYANYSDAKLSHYVDDPDEFRGAVPKTWLKTVDADAFKIDFEDSEGVVKHKAPEITSVISTFASDETIGLLREIHSLAERGEYEEMRRAHLADEEVGDTEVDELEKEMREAEKEIDEIDSAVRRIEEALEDTKV